MLYFAAKLGQILTNSMQYIVTWCVIIKQIKQESCIINYYFLLLLIIIKKHFIIYSHTWVNTDIASAVADTYLEH